MEMTELTINYLCRHHCNHLPKTLCWCLVYASVTHILSRSPFYAIIVIIVSLNINKHHDDIIFEGVQEASLTHIGCWVRVDLEAATHTLTVSNSYLDSASVLT